MNRKWFALGVGFLMLALLPGLFPTFHADASLAANSPPYLLTTIPVGKHPKGVVTNWSINRVYVAMFDASCVQVVNGDDLTLGTCAYSQGLHPNQLSLFGFDNLYVTNRDSNSISLLDAHTMQVLHWSPTGKLPWSVIAANDKVFVGNFGSSSVSVFDLQLDQLLATIPLPNDAPGLMTFGYWGIYVPGWKTGALYAINTRDNTLTNPVSVGPGAFAVAENQYTRQIFVTNRLDNTVHVFAKDGFVPLRTIPLPGPPYGIAVNPKTDHLFAVDALNDVVYVVDTYSGQLLTQLAVGRQDQEQGGQGLAINLETNRIYVTNYADDSMTVIQDVYPDATAEATSLATNTGDTPNTAGGTAGVCLGCHGPFTELASKTSDYAGWPNGETTTPHRFVPHSSTDIPECILCHKPHAVPPQASDIEAMGKPEHQYCFSCHHAAVLKCGTCHQ